MRPVCRLAAIMHVVLDLHRERKFMHRHSATCTQTVVRGSSLHGAVDYFLRGETPPNSRRAGAPVVIQIMPQEKSRLQNNNSATE